ncbi:MAG: TIGR00269 family protein [Euryarchaeota archaeon]|nr:TIGR00269 family protein [Euryarchaeota archaeon]
MIHVPYSGAHLCGRHFQDFFDRRVKREVRTQIGFDAPKRIAVAVSGGKDSVVLLHTLHQILGDDRRVELLAITVDEGIEGYRPAGVEAAKKAAARVGVEHRLVRFEDRFNVTLDELVAENPQEAPCASCGVLRRRALNDAAREAGADVLATGHNLDDTAQSILMNYVKGDVVRMARLAPHGVAVDGLVPRAMPLRLIPEREVALVAMLNGYEVDIHDCPNAAQATRGVFRDILLDLEERHPGTRHSLVAGHDRIAPLLREAANGLPAAKACKICGDVSTGPVCRACQMTDKAMLAKDA